MIPIQKSKPQTSATSTSKNAQPYRKGIGQDNRATDFTKLNSVSSNGNTSEFVASNIINFIEHLEDFKNDSVILDHSRKWIQN